jgi:hypothetical protein
MCTQGTSLRNAKSVILLSAATSEAFARHAHHEVRPIRLTFRLRYATP